MKMAAVTAPSVPIYRHVCFLRKPLKGHLSRSLLYLVVRKLRNREAHAARSPVQSRWLCGFGAEQQVGAAPGTPGGADAAPQVPGLRSVRGAEPASLGS